ncbi:MAG: alpha/beta fold hydrolase, partial [Anaerolineales bacterium]|nr:alpha/beta fold hydrolase [Anaerolineales bacterium]
MKYTLLLLAFLLAGCLGTTSPTPLPTAVPPTDTPSTLPEPDPTDAPTEASEPTAEPTVAPTTPPEPTAEPTATDGAPYPAGGGGDAPYPAPGPVSFSGKNNLTIFGTLYLPADAPKPWPGVLLLHMLGGGKGEWEEPATRLAEAGYAVLAIDMRGHGETNDNINWTDAGTDHQQAINYLAGLGDVDPDRIGIMGGSIGANMALRAGATREGIRTVVLLSPGLDYAGVTTESALSTYGDRPIMIVASSEDTYAAESSETLADQAQGEVNLVMYDGAGHGTRMFPREEGLITSIIEWFDTHMN